MLITTIMNWYQSMKVKVVLYGRLKAEFNQSIIEFELPEKQTEVALQDVYLSLCQNNNIKPTTHLIKPILNDTFAEWSDSVQAGDEVGFFPPASGG